jgi:hypothetical protein
LIAVNGGHAATQHQSLQMNTGDKITTLHAPELIEKPWSGREAWRVFGIIAEFAQATERLKAILDHCEKRDFEPSAREREARLDL